MDTQEGQVKTLDATRNQQLQRQYKAEDMGAIFSLYNGTPQANQLLQNKITDAELSAKEFFFGRGLATRERVVDKDGNGSWAYKLSPPAQFEMQKNISEDVGNSILTLAATNPHAAKLAMQEFGKYVLPTTQVKLNKAIGEKDKQDTAYGQAYNAVILNDANAEVIKKTEDAYLAKNDTDGLKEFRTQVSRIRTEQVKSEKDVSADALALVRKKFYSMPADQAAKIPDLRSALGDPDFLKAYSGMTKTDQDAMARMFNNTQSLSLDALSQVQQDLASGNVPKDTFVEHVNQLPVKYRKPFYDAYLGFNIAGYKGNPSKDSMASWYMINTLAKKDDSIFDTTDAESTMEAQNAWFEKMNSEKKVYPPGTNEAQKVREEFIDEMRKKNQGWWSGWFNKPVNGSAPKAVVAQPKFGQTDPIGLTKPTSVAEDEKKKMTVYIQQGMTPQAAAKKIVAERNK